jgi:hypothetical protein
VLVDDGQDRDPHRLRLIEALALCSHVLIPYDDFQCLKVELEPSPVSVRLPSVCKPEVLSRPTRCRVPALLDASFASRSGLAPVAGQGFKVAACASAAWAAALLASTIHFARIKTPKCSVAVITPARKGGYLPSQRSP